MSRAFLFHTRLVVLLSSLIALGGGWAVAHAQPAAAQPVQPLVTIPQLDLARYVGTWYEIAKFPNRFQRMCASNTQAEYRALPSGQLEVINRCINDRGETVEAVGRGRQVGGATSAKLEVRFAPAWLSFLPSVWGNYWVIDLDPGYQLVAVSEPSREFLWILSRTPAVDAASYEALLKRLRAMGFDIQRLESTRQP
jgi:apolipoprotein D and lipocalin family protein